MRNHDEHVEVSSIDLTSWNVTQRQLHDLELLLNGGFAPLDGFLTRDSYNGVLAEMRLSHGALWPIPITLDVTEEFADSIELGETIALRDPEGVMLASLLVEEKWQPDREAEASHVFGTTNTEHPGVAYLFRQSNPVYLGGPVTGLRLPIHYDFQSLRLAPDDVKREFQRRGWSKIVAFQTRNPMHRAHVELTMRAAQELEANLLIHPVVGMTKPGDVDHYTRVRAYQHVMARYPEDTALLSLLPLAMRMAGPREALWHALIRRNYGVTHLILGRDHAGPGNDSSGRPFYGPYEAKDLLRQYEDEIGVAMVPFRQMVYVPQHDRYEPVDEIVEGTPTRSISGTDLRERLNDGREIPDWFTYPEVAEELRRTHPARNKQGLTVFFTGLSGAGKSTIANGLLVKLLEIGGRPVTLLDGDIVRKNLSSELGFSKEHRDLNIMRIGFVASEITKNGGIAICAPIAPYDWVRKQNRETISAVGGFILVHVSTPLKVCEERDRKGLYAKARAGLIEEFTGISDPYEEPLDAELAIDTSDLTPEEAVNRIMLHLEASGYIGA